jgi:hypothetical protein
MPEFGAIFAAYEFVARSFMDLAGKKTSDRSIDLSIRFSNLLKFFEAKATPLNKVKGTLLGNVPARIDLPLFFAYLDNPFGKNVPDHAVKIFKLEKEAKVCNCVKFILIAFYLRLWCLSLRPNVSNFWEVTVIITLFCASLMTNFEKMRDSWIWLGFVLYLYLSF